MRYSKLICTEFYFCCLQQCLSIDLFSYRIPGHDQKGHMDKVPLSFCLEVLLKLALQFFLEVSMMLGAHEVLSMTEPDILKIMFCPKNGEIRPSLWFFECIGKFSFFLNSLIFFSIWSSMRTCIIVIAVCLIKFHIWENSGS